jgi:hypothetical protein
MSNLYDEKHIDAGITATGERGSCEHERHLRRSGMEIRCDRCDVIAVLDAAAPLIAARALRDAADRIRKATHERLQRYEGAPRETASLAIDGTVNLLERLADEAKRGE